MNTKLIFVAVVVIIGTVWVFNSNNTSIDSEVEVVIEVESENEMSFFVTSQNPGTGANFGGLSGADQYCQLLATEAGAGGKTWKAYLSVAATDSQDAINARDRIGEGPWYNFNGTIIANSVSELHSDNAINKENALSEKGESINGRGDSPNVHDILTGSQPDGTASTDGKDTTCSNWTSQGEGSAIVGHHDRMGLDESESSKSWNSSHGSRGCSLENLNGTGGGGLLYCFATEEDTEAPEAGKSVQTKPPSFSAPMTQPPIGGHTQ